jgi:hypothetical protein
MGFETDHTPEEGLPHDPKTDADIPLAPALRSGKSALSNSEVSEDLFVIEGGRAWLQAGKEAKIVLNEKPGGHPPSCRCIEVCFRRALNRTPSPMGLYRPEGNVYEVRGFGCLITNPDGVSNAGPESIADFLNAALAYAAEHKPYNFRAITRLQV